MNGWRVVGCGLLAVGLALIQILPVVEWLKLTFHTFGNTWPPQPRWSILGWVSRDVR